MSAVKNPPTQLKPAAAQVTEILRQWILTGRLGAGQHIGQEAIAKEFGVSRAPVREALAVLDAEGVIVRERYKGAFVAEISLAEVKETYLLRDLLEVFLFDAALPHITEHHLKRAEEIIRESNEARIGHGWARLNREFHMILYKPAQLPLVLQTLRITLRRTDRYFQLQQIISPTLREESRDQHQHIVDTIRSRDRETALQVMRQHIQSNADEVIQYLEHHLLAGSVPVLSA